MSSQKRFQRFNLATIVSVYVLILVGAIVRSQGAGMGCPDWPKCFGSYIPPASASSLPENYESLFLEERVKKNERLASTLSSLGFADLANKVVNDPNISETHPFDTTKAWIEYGNRLVGVLIGIFVFFNMVFAFQYRKENVWIPMVGVFIFILTGFQGWVGSLVVSTNLLPGFITFHMMLALLIVVLLIWMNIMSQRQESWMVTRKMKWVLGAFAVLLVPQIITGTLTREQVDVILDAGIDRGDLVAELTGSYFIHRSYSWLLMGLAIVSFFMLKKNGFYNWPKAILGVVLIEFLLGISLAFLGMPAWIQPLHLVLATLLFGGLFYLFLRVETVNV